MKNKPIYKKWWFWLLIIIGIGATNDLLDNGKFDSSTSETTTTTVSSNTTTSSVTTTTAVTTSTETTTSTSETTKQKYAEASVSEKTDYENALRVIFREKLKITNFTIDRSKLNVFKVGFPYKLKDGTEFNNVFTGSAEFVHQDKIYKAYLDVHFEGDKFNAILFSSDYNNFEIDVELID